MRIVALALCIFFILWLVIRDIRRRPSVSAAMWIPTVLLLILGSRQVSSWMSSGSGGAAVYAQGLGNDQARSPLDQLFWFGILTSSFVIATMRGVKWARIFATNPTVMAFYLYFLVSVAWSGDPVGSLKRIVKDFGLIFVIGLFFSEKDPFQSLRAVYARCAFILFPLSLVFIRYYPALGRAYTVSGEPMATGVTMQKNSLGETVLVFTLFLVWDYMEELRVQKFSWGKVPWDRALLVLMGLYVLNQSESRSALLCLCVGSALIIRGPRFVSKGINRGVLTGAIALPFLLFFSQKFSSVIAPIVEALGRNMTFTGRTDIWEHITTTTVSPLIGAGFWNFWGGPGGHLICEEMQTGVNNAHCGYVDMYLDGGIIGLGMLLILLVSCGNRLVRRLSASADTMRFERVRFALLIVAIIYNLAESTFARASCIWFTALLALVTIPPLKAHVRKSRTVFTEADEQPSSLAVSNGLG